jgi:hypothetical protein
MRVSEDESPRQKKMEGNFQYRDFEISFASERQMIQIKRREQERHRSREPHADDSNSTDHLSAGVPRD